jgi:hypothetical protein
MGDSDVDLVGTEQDDALLAELRAVAAVRDPVPDAVLDAAKATLTWRTIDAELAALAYDSAVEAASTAGALVRDRSATREYRMLTFEAGDVSVEVEISGTGRTRRLTAQVVPPTTAEVEVRSPHGTTTTTTDDSGHLLSVEIAPGPVSLRVRVLPDGPTLVTEWVTA